MSIKIEPGTFLSVNPADIVAGTFPGNNYTFNDLTIATPSNIYALSHDSFANFVAGEHFLQSAITTVGTIGTGVWQGTAIANTYIAGIDQNLLTSSSPTFASGVTIGNLTLANGSITDSSGAISFGNENLSTTGTLGSGNFTATGNILSYKVSQGTNITVNADADQNANFAWQSAGSPIWQMYRPASSGDIRINEYGVADQFTFGAGGNFGIGITAFGTSAGRILGIGGSTAPTTAPADMIQMWSQDRDGTAGDASLHYRMEGGIARPFDRMYDVRDYGASSAESAANNRTYIQAAIDAAPTSGTVIIPRMSAVYSMDNSPPLTITHGLTLIIQGEIDFTRNGFETTGNTTNTSAVITTIPSTTGMSAGMNITGTNIPANSTISSVDSSTQVTISQAATGTTVGGAIYVGIDFCDVTGNDVTIIGQGGKIKGPGTFVQNGAIVSSVFHVTGDRFTCRDLTLEDPVQCGIFFDGAPGGVVDGVRIVGGSAFGSGTGTQNYGIEIEGATTIGVLISGIHVVPNPTPSVTLTGATISFADANPDEIRDSNNGLGIFTAGQHIKVSGSTSNDGTQYEIASVAAGTLVLRAADTLTVEAAGATVTVSTVDVMVEGVAGGTASGLGHITLTGCYFESCHDHATYLFGDYNTITGNTVTSIPGSSLKFVGKYLTITGNVIKDGGGGGIEARNTKGTTITGNTILNFNNHAIEVSEYGTYTDSFDNIVIANNTMKGNTSGTVYSGVSFDASDRSADNVIIANNIIQNADWSGNGYHAIWVRCDNATPQVETVDRVKIDGNIIDTVGGAGIVVNNVSSGSIGNNYIRDPAQQAAVDGAIVLVSDCDDIYVHHNQIIKETGGNAMNYGIYITATDPDTITGCIFENNKIAGDGTEEIYCLAAEITNHTWITTDSSGYVGINRPVPSTGAFLEVGGNIAAIGDTCKVALHNAAGTERAFLQLNETILNINADSDIRFYPNNTPAANFTAAGNVEFNKSISGHLDRTYTGRLVPTGTIVAWIGGYFTDGSNGGYTNVLCSNTVAAANTVLNPEGWYVCNGAILNLSGSSIWEGAGRYLPNLTDDRFIMGDTTIGGIGGSSTMAHTHTEGSMSTTQEGAHTHGIGGYVAAGEAAHTHGVGSYSNAIEGAHTHTMSFTSGAEASHTHTYNTVISHTHTVGVRDGGGVGIEQVYGTLGASAEAYVGATGSTGSASGTTSAGSSHTHGISGTSSGGSNHSHGFSGASAAGSSHTHTLSGTSEGGSNHNHSFSGTTSAASNTENRPKFLGCFYIMQAL